MYYIAFLLRLGWFPYKDLMKEKNHEILTALHYKPLYNINHSEKWGKKYKKTRVIMAHVLTVDKNQNLLKYTTFI